MELIRDFSGVLVVISAKSETSHSATTIGGRFVLFNRHFISLLFLLGSYASKNSISLLSVVNLTIALRRLFV